MRAFDVATNDPKHSSMAGRYAAALFDLADEEGQVEKVEKDINAFQSLLDMSEDLRTMVASPVVPSEEQSAAVAGILEKAGIGGLTANFFKLIAKNRRLFAIPDMITSFRAIAAEARGEVTAEVTSAAPLTDQQTATLKATLKDSVGKDVQLDTTVDPSILGGLIVKVGSRMVDSSLRSKLSAMKVGLKGASA
ncbi:MAG: F0F1 ATP synthase subunit delta [Hyphomicrobiaceae bacterium]